MNVTPAIDPGHEKGAELADEFSRIAARTGCTSMDVLDALVIILNVYSKFEDVTMLETVTALMARLVTIRCRIELDDKPDRAKA